MTRVLSALVLIPLVVGTIWFLPSRATLVLAVLGAFLAFLEYAAIAAAMGIVVSRPVGGTAVILVAYAVWFGGQLSDVTTPHGDPFLQPELAHLVLMSALIVAGAIGVAAARPLPGALADVSATLFAPIYIGLPLGALANVRSSLLGGREALLLLMFVIVTSDSAQYYTGRAFGRRPLAPAISPKKTREGAIGGLVFGTLAMIAGGRWVFPSTTIAVLALVGATLAALGIVGDLFESLLKRSAGIKDSSQLIPGHGGVLDRIDSWLFAAPVYYVFVRYLA
jgi:phosphatidate cytidylyltransferase